MHWLGDVIPNAASTDRDLLDLRLRALDAARLAANPRYGAYVPLLPADAYKEQVNNILNYVDAITSQINQYALQIEQRKQEELTEAVGQALNQNIIQSGQLLNKIVQASAAQQHDLSGYYDAVITQKQNELSQAQARISTLQASLQSRNQVGNVIIAYKSAVDAWKTQKEIELDWRLQPRCLRSARPLSPRRRLVRRFKSLPRW